MDAALKSCELFKGISEIEIEKCLACCGGKVISFEKNEAVFHQTAKPQNLYILIKGAVAVCHDATSGKRTVVTTICRSGDLFGEVYLFLNRDAYDYYALAVENTKVLKMPKAFFYEQCEKGCGFHARLIQNMLTILATKAHFLTRKVQLLSSASLRQKIVKALLQFAGPDGSVRLNMNREEMADYIGAARPSLSRELMRMQEDGLIAVKGKKISIIDMAELENCV